MTQISSCLLLSKSLIHPVFILHECMWALKGCKRWHYRCFTVIFFQKWILLKGKINCIEPQGKRLFPMNTDECDWNEPVKMFVDGLRKKFFKFWKQKNDQNWSKMIKNEHKWLKMIKNYQNRSKNKKMIKNVWPLFLCSRYGFLCVSQILKS